MACATRPLQHKAAKASTAGRTAVADAEAGGSSSGNSSAAADGASSSGRNWLLRVPSPAYTIPGAALLLVALALGLGLGLPPLLQRSRGRALGPAAGADAYAGGRLGAELGCCGGTAAHKDACPALAQWTAGLRVGRRTWDARSPRSSWWATGAGRATPISWPRRN